MKQFDFILNRASFFLLFLKFDKMDIHFIRMWSGNFFRFFFSSQDITITTCVSFINSISIFFFSHLNLFNAFNGRFSHDIRSLMKGNNSKPHVIPGIMHMPFHMWNHFFENITFCRLFFGDFSILNERNDANYSNLFDILSSCPQSNQVWAKKIMSCMMNSFV